MPNVIGFNFVGNRRPRAYQGHFALQHIPKLRNLVKAGAPQQFPDPGDSRIVRNLIDAFLASFLRSRTRLSNDEISDVLLVNSGIGRNIH